MGTNVSTSYITAPANPKETLGIKLPFLVMIIKNVPRALLYYPFSWKSTSHSRCRSSTTRTSGDALGPPTISRPHASSPLSAPCLCGSTRAGTRSSSTCPISHAAPTGPTTSRRCVCRSTLTAGSEESTFQIGFIRRRSCPQNSSSSFRSRSSSRLEDC